jgi:hypothetical protein
MNRLRIRLNDGKRFVCWAALAAVFVVLAGGVNALAIPTYKVLCVPNAGISPECTSGAGRAHIQDAVYDASAGDVILVGPGYYNETVYVDKSNLSIFGAQAGNDARVRQCDPSQESIVDASPNASLYGGGAGAAFWVGGSYDVIDGFTIQGGTGGDYSAGIYVYGDDTYYSARLVNNIIQNNAIGIDLYYYPYDTLIEYNLFKTNNTGTVDDVYPTYYQYPAYGPGYGIVGYTPYYGTTITENAFEGNLAAAILLYAAYGTEITKNTSKNDGSFVALYYCYYTFVDHNQGRNFGAKGSLPWYSGVSFDAAIDLIYYNEYIQINDNDLEKGKKNGIAFSDVYEADYTCEYCEASNNTVKQFADNGIVAEKGDTLYYSVISGNDVEDNGNDGIFIEYGSYNYDNSLFDNKALNNQKNDCEDNTAPYGIFTATTYNTWFNNIGSMSLPNGLCTARGWRH